jgi:hypothetical protein
MQHFRRCHIDPIVKENALEVLGSFIIVDDQAGIPVSAGPVWPTSSDCSPRPPGVSLERMKVEMSLILHASPEQGWTQLQKFLKDIQQELVVGVYEFTAPHIEKAILDGLKSPEKLTLTLDSPPAKKSRERRLNKPSSTSLRS